MNQRFEHVVACSDAESRNASIEPHQSDASQQKGDEYETDHEDVIALRSFVLGGATLLPQITIQVRDRSQYLRFCGFFPDFVRSITVRHAILFIRIAKALLLPATAQRLVELHEGQQFISICLSQVEFGGEGICLVR